MPALDWDDLRFLLALSRHRTATAAAAALRVSQPTVGRRLRSLEHRLGSKLFRSTPGGVELSTAGETLVRHAERMEGEALSAERLASGTEAGIRGKVAITASEWLVSRVLGPGLAPFVLRHPELHLHLRAGARWLNLARGEADVALRPAAFQQQSVVQREVARIAFGVYASEPYLARRGSPDFRRGCPGHSVLAMDDEDTRIADLPWLRTHAGDAQVVARANGRDALAAMAAAGMGLACLPRLVGDATVGLRRLTPPEPPPERRLWLGVHRELRQLTRIKAVVAFLVELLTRLRPALAGQV